MSKLRAALLALLALFAMPAIAAEAVAARPAGFTGKWLASVDAGGGNMVELTFDLKAEGDKLTGTLLVMGNATPIAEGRIKGDDATFQLNFDTGQGGPPLLISYVGKLKDDTITMRSSFSMGEGMEPMVTDFTARRAPVTAL